MDEVRARIIAHSPVLQLESGLSDFTGTDAGDEEVNRLSFDVQAVSGGTTATSDEQCIVFR